VVELIIAALSLSITAPSSVTVTDAEPSGKLYPAALAANPRVEKKSRKDRANAGSLDKSRKVIFSPPCVFDDLYRRKENAERGMTERLVPRLS
jgi:hypothetical protein